MNDSSGSMEGCIESDIGFSSNEWASTPVAECLRELPRVNCALSGRGYLCVSTHIIGLREVSQC